MSSLAGLALDADKMLMALHALSNEPNRLRAIVATVGPTSTELTTPPIEARNISDRIASGVHLTPFTVFGESITMHLNPFVIIYPFSLFTVA
jgi:hypothetical protein